jgi:nucleobase:cation symporter-1, NCS1 family
MAEGAKRRVAALKEKVRLHGDEANHEQTDYWSNRDLIPLPPNRRTWGML